MPDEQRSSFTLGNLFAVIAVVGLMMALLLPSINRGRTSGRRSECMSNLYSWGRAFESYASRKPGRAYPGYRETLAITMQGDGLNSAITEYPVSWVVPMLRDLEHRELYRHWKSGDFLNDPGGPRDPVFKGYSELFVCPSHPPTTLNPPPCSYVANCGQADVPSFAGDANSAAYPADWIHNGVFFNRHPDPATGALPGGAPPNLGPIVTMTKDFISDHDGTTNTLLLSENVNAGSYADLAVGATETFNGFVWWPQATVEPNKKINGETDPTAPGYRPIWNARPSSDHPGGVNVVFCDGHTRFLSQDIDYRVYCLLMTPNGQDVATPGYARDDTSDPNTAIYEEYHRVTPLDENQIQ